MAIKVLSQEMVEDEAAVETFLMEEWIARRLDKTDVAVYALCRRGLKGLHDLIGPITSYLTRL